jgi:glycerol-3-phosphate dehydrogenase (NAD(P)+)
VSSSARSEDYDVYRKGILMQRVAILGAGAMGAALITPLIHNGHEVRLWGTEFDTALLSELRAGRPHPRLGMTVDAAVQLYDPQDLAQVLADATVVVLAITSDGIISILRRAILHLRPRIPLMMVTKGFGYDTNHNVQLFPTLVKAELPWHLQEMTPIVAVGGPCKANEVAAGWPTATVYGSDDSVAVTACQKIFQTPVYRIRTTSDVIGLEIAAALKNAYAIALGICNGLEQATEHPWHDLKAAMFAQALAEMAHLAQILGGRSETINGLPGAGDLEVTALSGRNRILGERLGRGEKIADALEAMRRAEQTVEGVAAVRFAVELVSQLVKEGKHKVSDYPLLGALHKILNGAPNLVELLTEAGMPPLAR